MKFFRREVEISLKVLGVVILAGLIVLPIVWGYQQRAQARMWQNVACAYRIKEVTRQTPFMTGVERTADACATLARLGFKLTEPDFVPLATSWRSGDGRSAAVGTAPRYGPVASTARYGTVARTSAFASPSGPERTSTR
jgi:hypothetical protein